MKKLQQYYIFKISTTQLNHSNYNITMSFEEAQKSSKIISLGDSQMLRTLRQIKGINVDTNEIDILLSEKRKIKRRSHNKENLKALLETEQKLKDLLFVSEIISIFVDDIRHYKHIGKNGFILNNKKYVRFACGAGQARRNNALFIDEEYEEKMYSILNNDRDNIEITPAKYNAYFSLSTSASIPVSEPYFCVVPDKEVIRTERVDFVKEIENGDDEVIETDRDIIFNLWDGQGIISPKMAKQWAEELELDYIPSSFIIRSNFIKGLVVVIDFHKFSDEIGKRFITDIYGNNINTRDMDVILTQSQFKLWNAFSSISDYKKKSKLNNLQWSVSRVAPKHEKKHIFLNYQFIQALNLDDQSIKNLCLPTVNYFKDIIKSDISKTLLYFLGRMSDGEYDKDIFNKINDKVVKAIILNNQLLKDPYVQNNIIHSLNKKIKQSYIGNLVIDGSYTMRISDPYAFLEYIFDLPIRGLLQREEHYNKYWINSKESKLAAMRAPLTWRSEVNILNLKSNEKTEEWFQYLDNCVVYNVFGNDCLREGGADVDGDLICVTNNKEIINGAYGGLPIDYENKKAPKKIINKNELYLSDIQGFDNSVGFVTNVATTAFALLPKFEEGSKEHSEIIKRLKCFRKEQGSTIDATKGLEIKPFPIHWTKWNKIKEDDSEEIKKEKEFLNSICINQRVYFMRWLYPKYNVRFNNYYKSIDLIHVRTQFKKKLEDILNQYKKDKSQLNEKEISFVNKYYALNPFLETDCVMNNVSNFMVNSIKEIKLEDFKKINEENILILKDSTINTDKEKLKKLYDLYKQYKKEKKNINKKNQQHYDYNYETVEQFNSYFRNLANNISSNGSELVNLAIDICYIIHPSDNKSFLWNVFGEDLIINIIKNKQDKIKVPFLDPKGSIDYLGNKYEMKIIEINDYIGEIYDYFG